MKTRLAGRYRERQNGIPGRLSSIVEVQRIQGPIFNSKEAAEEHGLKLCKDWIDKRR